MHQRINNKNFNANNKKSTKKQRGMTFIEVLVSLFIMVTGILGAVAMQANAKKGSFDAMQRSLASSLTQDIIERMRSNDFNTIGAYRYRLWRYFKCCSH
ncbi:type IV pilus modification protein PilV [Colwellia sp. MSW7]|uniref:Type IV pilus modification protein PilV n=1 Tax=Colwellia maritima TaxID=2912588 RepID=A0ABS9WYR2_9GAMM|nr:type IV pilus modification protein PilV [Colwellia maritima]MCI2283138.1 type IV pilus modification protein PilV [Colwellia maritima]